MSRLSILFVATFAVMTVNANAQHVHQHAPTGHTGHLDHDYWHPPQRHVPSVVNLDHYSDQLANIARHLHEDAHKLSQDYEHSASIERYVDSVDRLQSHMHEILHHAVESGRQSTGLISHVMQDVRQVKALFGTLSGELQHQGVDGARTQDFHAMNHMRQILAQNAFPLIRQMEVELYGYALGGNPVNQHVVSGHTANGHASGHSQHSVHGQIQTYPAQTYPSQTYPPQPYRTMRPPVQQPTQTRPSVRLPSAPIGNLLRSAIRSIR